MVKRWLLYKLIALVLVGMMATAASAGLTPEMKQSMGLDPANPAVCNIHAPAINFDTKTFPGGINFFLFILNYASVTERFSITSFFFGEFDSKGFGVNIDHDKPKIFGPKETGVTAGQVADIFVCWGVNAPPASVLLLQIGSSFTTVPPITIFQ